MASVVLHGRNIRRSRTTRMSDQDVFKLDNQKDISVNLQDILTQLTLKDVSRMRKLSCYNAVCRLLYRVGSNVDTGLDSEFVLVCLRPGLFSSFKEIRTACLRSIRYVCQSWDHVAALITLHMDYLIVRSLDIRLDNEVERVHALRLIRKIMFIDPLQFPLSLLRPIISIANDGTKERDKLVRTCLATICELTLYNSELVAKASGISTIIQGIQECHSLSRINESLTSVIIYLLNSLSTRRFIWPGVDLEQMLAPFTDNDYKVLPDSTGGSNTEDVEQRYEACKMSLVCILKSWPGLYWLCRPESSALQSLIKMLYLPNMENRKEILDIIYDVFRLPVPDWTESFDQALVSVDLSEMNDNWKLLEGFVVDEGKRLLPHCSKTRPDLVVTHSSLLLAVFIRAGLLESLVDVLVTSSRLLTVRATILLGELLYMSSQLLPAEISRYHQCLPSLITKATLFDTSVNRHLEASAAVRCLQRIYAMRNRGCIPASLFLNQLIYSVNLHNARVSGHAGHVANQVCHQCGTDADRQVKENQDKEKEIVNQAIRDSQVLYTKDNNSWDWGLVSIMLMDNTLRKMQDQLTQRFIRRLLFVLTPTKKIYSVMDLSSEMSRNITQTALHLIDFLTADSQPFVEEIEVSIKEFLDDICTCLNEVKSQLKPSKDPPLFSPSNLAYTCCQNYFLFLGRFSSSDRGNTILEDNHIYQILMSLVSSTTHDSCIKLVVSSLDYNREGSSRLILSKALKATSETARLYVTGFMRVLMRAKVDGFSGWGIEALVAQLYDSSSTVSMEALSVLSEATEVQSHLMSLIRLKPSVLHLGHKGELLLARFLSIEFGFNALAQTAFISSELEKWRTSYNMKYVGIVEERLNEALTTYEKTYDGSYVRRSHHRTPRKDVYLPVHLYGQLVLHADGCKLLDEQPYLVTETFYYLRSDAKLNMDNESDVAKVKSSLWAAGHIGRSEMGLDILKKHSVVDDMVRLAENSSVYAVRGTAFYALGLIASTTVGADMLQCHGWETVRHCRSESERLWLNTDDDYLLSSKIEGDEFSEVHGDINEKLSLRLSNSGKSGLTSDEKSVLFNNGKSNSIKFNNDNTKEKAASQNSGKKFDMIGLDGAMSSSSDGGNRSGRHLSDASSESTKWLQRNTSPTHGDIEVSDSVGGSSGGRSGRYLSESIGRGVSSGLPSVSEDHVMTFNDDDNSGDTGEYDTQTRKPAEDNVSISKRSMDARARFFMESTDTNSETQKRWSSLSPSTSPSSKFETAGDFGACQSNSINSADTKVSSAGMMDADENEMKSKVSPLKLNSNEKETTNSGVAKSSEVQLNLNQGSFQNGSKGLASSGELAHKFAKEACSSDAESCSNTPKILPIEVESGKSSTDRVHSSSERSRPVGSSASTCRVSLDFSDLPNLALNGNTGQDGKAVGDINNSRTSKSSVSLTPSRGATSPCLTAMDSTGELAARTVELRRKQGLNALRDIRGSARYHSVDQVSIGAGPELNRVTFAGFTLDRKVATISKSKSLDYRLSKTRSSIRNLVPFKQGRGKRVCSVCGGMDRKSYGGFHSSNLSSRVAVPNLDLVPGGPEFIGICIPMDLDAIFKDDASSLQVMESTQNCVDARNNSATVKTSYEICVGPATEMVSEFQASGPFYSPVFDSKIETGDSKKSLEKLSNSAAVTVQVVTEEDGDIEKHTIEGCLACYRIRNLASSHKISSTRLSNTNVGQGDSVLVNKLPQTDLEGAKTVGDSSSVNMFDDLGEDLTALETESGRARIKKDILRLVVNLSSSIGVKNIEQALLVKKQKYSTIFQDLCLYSQVSCLLATYNYRIAARRFIQELFQELDASLCLWDPCSLLGLKREEVFGERSEDQNLEKDLSVLGKLVE